MEFEEISVKLKAFVDPEEVDRFMNLERHTMVPDKCPRVYTPCIYIIKRKCDYVYVGFAGPGSLPRDVSDILNKADSNEYVPFTPERYLVRDVTSWRNFRIDISIERYLSNNTWSKKFSLKEYSVTYIPITSYKVARVGRY